MNYQLSREKFEYLKSFLINKYNINSDDVAKLILNLYEIDEDCEKLLNIVHQNLLSSVDEKNEDKLSDSFINYDIRLNHMKDHILELSKLLSRIMNVFGVESVNKD